MDKPAYPYGDPGYGDYEFQIDLGLTSDSSACTAAVNALTVLSGNDYEESQLSALMM